MKKEWKRNIDEAIQRESVQPTLHWKSTCYNSNCRNMQYHIQDALIYLNALTVTDEDDKMRHEPLQRHLYNSYLRSSNLIGQARWCFIKYHWSLLAAQRHTTVNSVWKNWTNLLCKARQIFFFDNICQIWSKLFNITFLIELLYKSVIILLSISLPLSFVWHYLILMHFKQWSVE